MASEVAKTDKPFNWLSQTVRRRLVDLVDFDRNLDRLRLLVSLQYRLPARASLGATQPRERPCLYIVKAPQTLTWRYGHSVKWVGMFVTALVGLYTVEDLWNKFGDLRMSFVSPCTCYVAVFGRDGPKPVANSMRLDSRSAPTSGTGSRASCA